MRLPDGESFDGKHAGNKRVGISIPAPGKVAMILMTCVLFLHAANLIRILIHWKTGHGNLYGLMPLFNVDLEGNFPAFYSAVALCVAAGLAVLIALRERAEGRPFWKHWFGIAAAFAWVTIDESCRIHELAIPLGAKIARTGVFFFSWIIPAMAVLCVLAVVYFRMIFSFPAWLRNLAILAAGVYISGALGLEMVGGTMWETSGPDFRYQLVCAVEELLEMLGVVIWIYALLRYLTVDGPGMTVALTFQPFRKA